MNPKQEKAHIDAIQHMKNATNRLNESVAVHNTEKMGLIGRDEAIESTTALNEEAGRELDQAIEAIDEFNRQSVLPGSEP